MKKLEARGVIRGYGAVVDPRAVGFDILAALYGGRATLVIDGGQTGFAVTVGLPLAPRNDLDSAA